MILPSDIINSPHLLENAINSSKELMSILTLDGRIRLHSLDYQIEIQGL